jgi:hypothetical protein
VKRRIKKVWIFVSVAIICLAAVWIVIESIYWMKRRAGTRIDAVVYIEGSVANDARVYRHNGDAHIVILDDEESYFLLENKVGYQPGPYWGEYFGSIYTKADGIYAEFPPSVKTEPWDPKPERTLSGSGRLESFRFTSIGNASVIVQFKE